MRGSIYTPPPNYGIPNPYGPRTHNWKGGPLNEGSLFHGPVYTRPNYHPVWIQQTLNGQVGATETEEGRATPGQLLMWMGVAAATLLIFAYTVRAEKSR